MVLLVALTTPQVGFHRTADVAYQAGDRGKLDVYAPSAPHPGAPIVVFIYGGGWEGGSKALYRFVGASLAKAGVVTVIPDYRVYPQVRYPAFLQDNARAVAWARDHAADYGADPHRLVLMGHSAGAYDAAMLALDPRWLAEVGMDPVRDIRGVIGLSGPYDFLPLGSETLKAIFGPPQTLPATQPINHVSAKAPPFMLAAGTADRTVLPRNSEHLSEALGRNGVPAGLKLYPGVKHPATITAFLPVFGSRLDVPRRSLDFIAQVTADAAAPRAAAE